MRKESFGYQRVVYGTLFACPPWAWQYRYKRTVNVRLGSAVCNCVV